uniref:Uncharacterized protein n=1 Tax=Romanomermis culicivorax TaxID=13658 RepID=A0A915L2C0_ROMCU
MYKRKTLNTLELLVVYGSKYRAALHVHKIDFGEAFGDLGAKERDSLDGRGLAVIKRNIEESQQISSIDEVDVYKYKLVELEQPINAGNDKVRFKMIDIDNHAGEAKSMDSSVEIDEVNFGQYSPVIEFPTELESSIDDWNDFEESLREFSMIKNEPDIVDLRTTVENFLIPTYRAKRLVQRMPEPLSPETAAADIGFLHGALFTVFPDNYYKRLMSNDLELIHCNEGVAHLYLPASSKMSNEHVLVDFNTNRITTHEGYHLLKYLKDREYEPKILEIRFFVDETGAPGDGVRLRTLEWNINNVVENFHLDALEAKIEGERQITVVEEEQVKANYDKFYSEIIQDIKNNDHDLISGVALLSPGLHKDQEILLSLELLNEENMVAVSEAIEIKKSIVEHATPVEHTFSIVYNLGNEKDGLAVAASSSKQLYLNTDNVRAVCESGSRRKRNGVPYCQLYKEESHEDEHEKINEDDKSDADESEKSNKNEIENDDESKEIYHEQEQSEHGFEKINYEKIENGIARKFPSLHEHISLLHKVGSNLQLGFLARDMFGNAYQKNLEGFVESVFFFGAAVGSSMVGKAITLFGQSQKIAGRPLTGKVLGTVGGCLPSVPFDVYMAYQQLKNNNNETAILMVVQNAINIYKKMKEIDQIVHLSVDEKMYEIGREVLFMGTDSTIQSMMDAVSANEAAVVSSFKMYQQFHRFLISGARKVENEGLIYMDDNSIDLTKTYRIESIIGRQSLSDYIEVCKEKKIDLGGSTYGMDRINISQNCHGTKRNLTIVLRKNTFVTCDAQDSVVRYIVTDGSESDLVINGGVHEMYVSSVDYFDLSIRAEKYFREIKFGNSSKVRFQTNDMSNITLILIKENITMKMDNDNNITLYLNEKKTVAEGFLGDGGAVPSPANVGVGVTIPTRTQQKWPGSEPLDSEKHQSYRWNVVYHHTTSWRQN